MSNTPPDLTIWYRSPLPLNYEVRKLDQRVALLEDSSRGLTAEIVGLRHIVDHMLDHQIHPLNFTELVATSESRHLVAMADAINVELLRRLRDD